MNTHSQSFFDLRKTFLRSLSMLFIVVQALGTIHAQQKNSEGLAKVALLDFADLTGSQNYAYLSGSLTSAINNSMQTKFEYTPADSAAIGAGVQSIQNKTGQFTDSDISELCKITQTDILIFGHYTFDPTTNQIVIQTKINFALINRTITLDPLLNPVDASLFQATDLMASKIVEKIAEMAKKTMSGTGNTVGQQGTDVEAQKVILSKQREISWTRVDNELVITGGFSKGADGKFASLDSGYSTSVEFFRNSDFRKSYAGLSASYFDQHGGGVSNTGWGIMLALGLNLFTIGERVKPYFQADLGYGSNSLSSIKNQQKGSIWIGARLGVKILLSERFAIYSEGQWLRTSGDTNSAIMGINLGIGTNF